MWHCLLYRHVASFWYLWTFSTYKNKHEYSIKNGQVRNILMYKHGTKCTLQKINRNVQDILMLSWDRMSRDGLPLDKTAKI